MTLSGLPCYLFIIALGQEQKPETEMKYTESKRMSDERRVPYRNSLNPRLVAPVKYDLHIMERKHEC